MDRPLQSILVPVEDEMPHAAIAYALLLSKAYNKPVAFLCFNASMAEALMPYGFHVTISSYAFITAVQATMLEQDAVMVVFQSNAKRRTIKRQLLACRDLRIPYFFIPIQASVVIPRRVALPMSFLIEDREKATWGRSLARYFKSEFRILQPNDKGTRAAKNVLHVQEFFNKNSIPYVVKKGKRSSFKNDNEASLLWTEWADLFMITASREYGLDDNLLGPKELHFIRKSQSSIMMLNPRDDLYILCGD